VAILAKMVLLLGYMEAVPAIARKLATMELTAKLHKNVLLELDLVR